MWLELQLFGFRALWSPYFFVFVLSLAILYYLLMGPLRKRFGDVAGPTGRQKAFLYTGLFLLYFVKGSPIDLLSHIMMSAHMTQMLFLYLVFPMFVIQGLPVWVWEWFIELPIINPIFRFVTIPLISLGMFSVLFAMYHLPIVFDFSKSSQFAHTGITLLLLVLAFIMWWPILSPVKKYDKLNPLLKMAYLLGNIFMVSIACALIIFATVPLYSAYTAEGAWIQSLSLCVPMDILDGLTTQLSGAEMFSPLSAVDDQQLGGIIMMFLQQGIFGFVIAWIFFGWFSKKNLQVDPMPDEVKEWSK